MSLGLMLVTLSAAMLATQPAIFVESVGDYKYNTTLIKGYAWAQNVKQVFRAKIPSKQCDGGIEYPANYKCEGPHGVHVPFALQVQVLDNGGAAAVSMDTQLQHASVYRAGSGNCEGAAEVIVSIACM